MARTPRPCSANLPELLFLRSSFDPEDVKNLQNIEERTIHTPRNIRLDSELTLELTVAEDGTAEPNFVYKVGRSPDESISRKEEPSI